MQTDPNHKQFFQVVLMKLCLVSVVSMCSGYNAGHPQPTCSPSGRQLMVKPFTENKASLVRWNQLVMAPGRKSGKEHSCLAAWQMLWHVVTVISVKLGDVMKCIDMYIYIYNMIMIVNWLCITGKYSPSHKATSRQVAHRLLSWGTGSLTLTRSVAHRWGRACSHVGPDQR